MRILTASRKASSFAAVLLAKNLASSPNASSGFEAVPSSLNTMRFSEPATEAMEPDLPIRSFPFNAFWRIFSLSAFAAIANSFSSSSASSANAWSLRRTCKKSSSILASSSSSSESPPAFNLNRPPPVRLRTPAEVFMRSSESESDKLSSSSD